MILNEDLLSHDHFVSVVSNIVDSIFIDNEIIQALINCGELDGPFDGCATLKQDNANAIVETLNV